MLLMLFFYFKILRKYAPKAAADSSGAGATSMSDVDSIQADVKSISSFNESFNTPGSQTTQQQIERELAFYKDRYLSVEEIRVTLTRDLAQMQELHEKSKENIKKLVKDKMDQEERIQILVSPKVASSKVKIR